MTRHSFISDRQAVSNMVSVVLLTGIVLVGLGTIGALGYSEISQSQNQFGTEGGTNQLETISNGIDDVTDTPKEVTRVSVNFGESSGGASVEENNGDVDVEKVEAPSLVGFENPAPTKCTTNYPDDPAWGDDNLDDRSIYDCSESIGVNSAVDTTIVGTSVVCQTRNPNDPTDDRCRVEGSTSASTSDPNGFGGRSGTVYVYDNNGNLMDTISVNLPNDGTVKSGWLDARPYYTAVFIARDSAADGLGDVGGSSVNVDGTTIAPVNTNSMEPGSKVIEGTVTSQLTGDLGAITYDTDGQIDEVAYQGGGIFQKQADGGSTVVSDPKFEIRRTNQMVGGSPRPDTLVLPFTIVSDKDGESTAISSSATIEDMGTRALYSDRYLAENDIIRVTITSEYAGGWRQYFRNRYGGLDSVNVAGSGNTAIIEFGDGEELYVHIRTSTVQING